MAQYEILSLLKKHKGQELTCREIALALNMQMNRVANSCQKLRRFGFISVRYGKSNIVYYSFKEKEEKIKVI